MNHSIIRDKEALLNFIDWLPELTKTERYFLCLQARKRYLPSIGITSTDKTQLKRFVSTKERLFDKICQLECPVGTYRTKSGEVIPDEAIALYITTNPRCMKKAAYKTIRAMADTLEKYDVNHHDINPHAEALSCIHRSKSRTTFVHFDIDVPDEKFLTPKCDMKIDEIYSRSVEVVGKEAVSLVQTRGGCHLLVDPSKVVSDNKNWYPVLIKEFNCDQIGDLMLPVVGCCQGGYVPRFVN